MGVKKITLKGQSIPAPLQNIPTPPKQLYVFGNLEPLVTKPCLAVVGSRKVSAYGKAVTAHLIEAAARQGIAIISGLALGVDGLAHEAALRSGGYTVAVLPCGLDHIYPSTHHHLAKQILEKGGALITEYPEGTEPYPTNFVARNRLVSGLSDGVLIIEAAERSGTLHTANFALEQGRAVMAVPGNITSPTSAGTNNLIRAGAIPITKPEDIFNALNLDLKPEQQEIFANNEAEHLILKLLLGGTTDSAELQLASQLEPAVFNQTLTMLEISGRIKALGAGHWTIS